MNPAETIAVIASAPGRSPVAIVRLAGPETLDVLRRVLAHAPTDAGAHHATLRLPPSPRVRGEGRGERLPRSAHAPPSSSPDLPLPIQLLLYRAPRSYTGDDAAELLIPGHPALAARVLDALLNAGAVRAEPGAFTARAYLAGRLTLAEAEGVNLLIAAERDEQAEAAQRLIAGETGAVYEAWADRLATMLALVEAGIDFTDQEDVVPIAPGLLASRLRDLEDELRGALGGATSRADAAEPIVVLVGPPNAGKSTLFNRLLGRDRAVVSDVAGTTRDAIEEPLDLSRDLPGAGAVRLVDLAGLSDRAADDLDAGAQGMARAKIATADVLIACDPTGRFDLELPDTPTLRVRTKGDLPGSDAEADDLAVCALDGWNIDPLRRAIADLAVLSRDGGELAAVPRHARAIRDAVGLLGSARRHIDEHARALDEPELVAGALRLALDELGSLTGEITPDEVIGRVFAAFCVGK